MAVSAILNRTTPINLKAFFTRRQEGKGRSFKKFSGIRGDVVASGIEPAELATSNGEKES